MAKEDIYDRVDRLEAELQETKQGMRQLEVRLVAKIEQAAIQLREMIRGRKWGQQVPLEGADITQGRTIASSGCPTDPRYQCATHGPGCPNRPKE